MSGILRIVQWEQHQHYKDRNPPWIKLHRDLLTSETWVSSSSQDRVLAVALMLLAAATGNRVPANPRYVQRRAYLDFTPDFSALIEVGFIEYEEVSKDASKSQASARPETETDTEKDSVANATGAVAPQGPSAVDLKKLVFDSGVPLLTSTGSTERNARSMIGRWCKEHGDGAVLSALALATAHRPADPIPWIRTQLESSNGKRSISGSRAGSLSDWLDEEERSPAH